jgi:hypothetical protein
MPPKCVRELPLASGAANRHCTETALRRVETAWAMFERGVRNISVEAALRWLQRFVTREWVLLMPVGLAFFALPRLILLRLTPQVTRWPQTIAEVQAFSLAFPAWWMPLFLATMLAGVVGAMALIALAVIPRITVGEAILIGLRKLPIWVGAGLIVLGAFFVGLLFLMTIAIQLGAGQALSALLTLIYMAPASLLMILIIPVLVDQRVGPWRAIRATWRLYTGALLRIAGALLLFVMVAYVVSLALQISLGSLFLLIGRASGQLPLGEVLAAILVSITGAIEWSGFYLLVAGFYRQRIGID